MEWLQTLSIALPIMVVLSGSGLYAFEVWVEPDFTHGENFTTAWMEYGVNQNTLNIEAKLDSPGSICFSAIEAIARVNDKSDINPKIHGKPLVIVQYVRHKTRLDFVGKSMVTFDELGILKHGSAEEKARLAKVSAQRVEVNESLKNILVEKDDNLVETSVDSDIVDPIKATESYIDTKFGTRKAYV